jgi:hypothetical protein
MPNDAEWSIDQIETLTSLARLLARSELTVYRCRYDFVAFGSWVIEAGVSHHRLQIARDGQARSFRFSEARLQNTAAVPDWKERGQMTFDDISSPAELEGWIGILIRNFAGSVANRAPSP